MDSKYVAFLSSASAITVVVLVLILGYLNPKKLQSKEITPQADYKWLALIGGIGGVAASFLYKPLLKYMA